MKKEIMITGLGRMGLGIAERLIRCGYKPYLFNRDYSKAVEVSSKGGVAVKSFDEFKNVSADVKIVWLMLPAGEVTNEYVERTLAILRKGDIIIDGSNSKWKNSIENFEKAKKKEVFYLDVGVSGGIWGKENGYCIMVGGDRQAFEIAKEYFVALSSNESYLYCGESGSGHFVKMIHNAIEYAVMQAYAEGFEMIKSFKGIRVSKREVAELWNKNSIIRSWLLELIAKALEEDDELCNIKPYVEDSGEGRWAVEYAVENAIPVDVISSSLFRRFRSRMNEPFYEKLLAAMRNQFGGHKVYKKDE